MGISYREWLEGDCGCNYRSGGVKSKGECDCNEIYLELSKQHTDDLILQDEIDDLGEEIMGKLDASAYTQADLSNYYTKEEVDERIDEIKPSEVDSVLDPTSTKPVENKVIVEALNGKLDASAYTSTDLSNYYTKSEVNNLIPSLDNYVTKSEHIQVISNLQEQINSLLSQVSGCCGSETGEAKYRWITETGENDYWCSGTTKYSKEKEQSSTDGITWTDTGNERNGSTILEENCVECGYVPPTTKAKAVITNYFPNFDDVSEQTSFKVANVLDTDVYEFDVYVLNRTGSSNPHSVIEYKTVLTYSDFDEISPDRQYWIGFTASMNKNDGEIIDNEFNDTDIKGCNLVSGITSIGDYAFANNKNLEYIASTFYYPYTDTEPLNMMEVDSIGDYAFANNPELTEIDFRKLTKVPRLGINVFANCPKLTSIRVNSKLLDEFKTAPGWSDYSSIIKPYVFSN